MRSGPLFLNIVGIVAGSASSLVCGPAFAQVDAPDDVTAFWYESVATFFDRENGRVTGHQRDRQFFRGDGSRAFILWDGTPREMRVIVNPGAGVRIEVRPVSETISTMWLGPNLEEREQQKRRACGRDPAAIRWTILGYEVVREETDMREKWLAPALGCVSLQTTQYGRYGNVHSVWHAENIVIGEPDPAMFRAPEGYVEMSSVDAQKLTAERLGLPLPSQ